MGTSEKKYLKWYNKLGYGSGDLAANCIYAVVTSFIMIYLTDAIGMDPAVIGMLIMVSKCLDGVSDVFFGNLMDTHTYGKSKTLDAMDGNRLLYLSGCIILHFSNVGTWCAVCIFLYHIYIVKCSILHS